MKLLVINGANINLLGIREPDIYGKSTYKDLVNRIEEKCERDGISVEIYQSNHEGDLVDKIGDSIGRVDGIVINPGAYTHTSIAIADALGAVSIPYVEVHISDVSKREDFRQVSYIRANAVDTVMGMGIEGYIKAIDILKNR